MNVKNKTPLLSVQTYQKREKFHVRECHVTMTKKDAFISNEIQLQNQSLFFIHKNISLHSATRSLSCSPMAYSTTASLDKLTCTDNVDFGESQDRFGRFTLSKSYSHYLDVELKVFKEIDNKECSKWSKILQGDSRF